MVVTDRVREIYDRHVRPLSEAERLQLLALVAEQLAEQASPPAGERMHDIKEFYGIASSNRIGMDAQEYVNKLRAEWDHRP
jgi:hypothetical protein